MSDTLKLCAFCGKEFTAKRSTAKFCSGACKLKSSRGYETKKQNPQTPPVMPTNAEMEQIVKKVVDKTETPETPEEWLARRVKETGSKKWQWVKTGNPPGSQPDIKVPQKWELSDIDKAKEYRGQWGERETSS